MFGIEIYPVMESDIGPENSTEWIQSDEYILVSHYNQQGLELVRKRWTGNWYDNRVSLTDFQWYEETRQLQRGHTL